MAELERKLKAHYSRMKTRNRTGHLTKDMVRRDGKAFRFVAKGAETKHVVPFALEIAVALHAAKGDEHSYKVLQCVSGLLDFYMCSTMKPYPVQSAQDATRIVATAYVDLATEALEAQENLWRIKPKIQMFMELGLFQTAQLGDPQSYWAYKDEYFMGEVSKIGASRGRPSSATATASRVIARSRALSSS